MNQMSLFDNVEVNLNCSRNSTTATKEVKSKLFTQQALLDIDIKPGCTTHYVSMGSWSMHDLLDYIIRKNGETAVVYGATWSASEDGIRTLVKLGEDGFVSKINMLFDWRVKVRRPEALAFAKRAFANLHTSSCHAKVFLIDSKSWKISIITSANLTNNPRIEVGVIETNPEIYEFHKSWLEAELAGSYPFDEERSKKR